MRSTRGEIRTLTVQFLRLTSPTSWTTRAQAERARVELAARDEARDCFQNRSPCQIGNLSNGSDRGRTCLTLARDSRFERGGLANMPNTSKRMVRESNSHDIFATSLRFQRSALPVKRTIRANQCSRQDSNLQCPVSRVTLYRRVRSANFATTAIPSEGFEPSTVSF